MQKNCDKYNRKIEQYADKDIFLIFYKDLTMCPYSSDAVEFLKGEKRNFKGYCVKNSKFDKKDKLIKCLAEKSSTTGFDPEHNTLPIIFYRGKFIGGYADLIKKYKTLF